MAISEMLPGLEVVVVQNGTEMIEHTDNDVEDNERTTTRYIEAKSDQEFAIRIGVTARTDFTGDTLACHVYVDGKWAQAPILEKSRFRWDNYVRYVRGVEVQNSLEKRFHFAGLETAEAKNISSEEVARVKELGSIVVKIYQTWMGEKYERTGGATDAQSIGTVSEKAIKGRALSHSVGLGGVTAKVPSSFHATWPVQGVPTPALTFIFNYRSTEALKSMLIIPRTPSPPPPAPLEERDPSTLTLDEIRELQRSRQELNKDDKSRIKKIKREPGDGNTRPRKIARPKAGSAQLEVDEDGSFRESSTGTVAEPEVIDLT